MAVRLDWTAQMYRSTNLSGSAAQHETGIGTTQMHRFASRLYFSPCLQRLQAAEEWEGSNAPPRFSPKPERLQATEE